MEDIEVTGNFAVKVGNMWAKKDYEGVKLTKQPDSLMEFKRAYQLAEETGGKVHMFNPQEISKEEMENLAIAAGVKTESEDN